MEQRRKFIAYNNLQNETPFRRSTFLGTQRKQAYPMLLIHQLKQGIVEEPPASEALPLAEPPRPPAQPAKPADPADAAESLASDDDCLWAREPKLGVWWHDPGQIAMGYEELTRKPASEPKICQPCLCAYFWEDIAGRMHCAACEPIPSLKMLKDFWQAIPGPERNAMRAWPAIGWDRWFPSPKTIEELFSHILDAQQKREQMAIAQSGF